MAAARIRTCSRLVRAAAVMPPPAGYLITPAYRTHRARSRRHADRPQPCNLCSCALLGGCVGGVGRCGSFMPWRPVVKPSANRFAGRPAPCRLVGDDGLPGRGARGAPASRTHRGHCKPTRRQAHEIDVSRTLTHGPIRLLIHVYVFGCVHPSGRSVTPAGCRNGSMICLEAAP
jgi:hypothetical protein